MSTQPINNTGIENNSLIGSWGCLQNQQLADTSIIQKSTPRKATLNPPAQREIHETQVNLAHLRNQPALPENAQDVTPIRPLTERIVDVVTYPLQNFDNFRRTMNVAMAVGNLFFLATSESPLETYKRLSLATITNLLSAGIGPRSYIALQAVWLAANCFSLSATLSVEPPTIFEQSTRFAWNLTRIGFWVTIVNLASFGGDRA